MEITYKKLDEIMPYERNPRHNEAAIEKVANSIDEFGFRQPIVIDAAGVIVAGHTRYEAAKRLGLERVPTTEVSDLSPYQVQAYRLADNKTAELSNWDHSLLEIEMEDLKSKFDMSDFGFDDMLEDFDEGMLDDLFEEEEEDDKEFFTLTIRFPKSDEAVVRELVDIEGKEYLTEIILEEAYSR